MLSCVEAKRFLEYRMNASERLGHRPVWNAFDNSLTEVALEMTDAELDELEAEWKETDRLNSEILMANLEIQKRCLKEIEAFCKDLGIETWKHKKSGEVKGEGAVFKELRRVMNAKCPCYKSSRPYPAHVRVYNKKHGGGRGAQSLRELVEFARCEIRSEKATGEKEKRQLALAASLAAKYKIDPLSPNVVQEVTTASQEAWLKEHEGTMLSCDCSECEEYQVGERRCVCGNRRVFVTFSGDIDNWVTSTECY